MLTEINFFPVTSQYTPSIAIRVQAALERTEVPKDEPREQLQVGFTEQKGKVNSGKPFMVQFDGGFTAGMGVMGFVIYD